MLCDARRALRFSRGALPFVQAAQAVSRQVMQAALAVAVTGADRET